MIKPKPTPPPAIEHKKMAIIAYAFAVAVIGVSVWQLVMFDDFAPALGSYIGTGVTSEVTLLATVLIGMQVFAVPFLVRLWLSPLARLASAGLAFLTPLAWTTVALAGKGLNRSYFGLAVLVFLWGGVSFWVLGGPKAMRVKVG